MSKSETRNMAELEAELGKITEAAVSRRRFLLGTGATAGAAILLAACGGDDDKKAETGAGTGAGSTNTSGSSGRSATGDLAVAELAAGLEVLAVDTYRAALEAATANKLGPVPPAVGEFVKTAMGHHEQHRDAWNKVLSGAGRSPITAPNAKLKPTVDAEFAKVKDVAGAAKLALMLEDIAAQTYLSAIPKLQSKDAIKTAASIQVIDQQHQSILLYALGMYPVPETFQKTDKSAAR